MSETLRGIRMWLIRMLAGESIAVVINVSINVDGAAVTFQTPSAVISGSWIGANAARTEDQDPT